MLKINLTNQRFGSLVVLRDIGRTKAGGVIWLCHCDCGALTKIHGMDLRSGNTASCGCLQNQAKHGHSRREAITPTYRSWQHMLTRCNNPKHIGFKHWGGRGITVCKRWRKFENFLTDMGERPLNNSIDRINPNGNYTPKNCRWATQSEQLKNRR